MNLVNLLSSALGKYGSLIVIVILLLVIVAIKFNAKVRKLAYQYIPEAENGSIVRHFKEGAYNAVSKLQASDLDERMVDVIAILLQQIPVLRIIPFSTATKYLNSLVQKSFDNIKKSLDTTVHDVPRQSRISETDLEHFLGETINSSNEALFEESNKVFGKLEKEVKKLKTQETVEKSDLKVLEDLIKKVYVPTLKK